MGGFIDATRYLFKSGPLHLFTPTHIMFGMSSVLNILCIILYFQLFILSIIFTSLMNLYESILFSVTVLLHECFHVVLDFTLQCFHVVNHFLVTTS